MTRRHSRMCLFGVWMTTHNIKGFKTLKPPPKGGVVRNFPAKVAKLENRNISGGEYRIDTKFWHGNSLTEPHSWLRGWSRITKFIFKMANGIHMAEYWKHYNSPINGPIWMKLRWSHPIMSPICLPSCGCHGNDRWLATAHSGWPPCLKILEMS